MRDFERAKEAYTRALQIDPENRLINGEIYFNRGLANHRLNAYNEAIKDFANALAIKGNNGQAWLISGHCFLEKKMYNKAVIYYNQAAEFKNDAEVKSAIVNGENLLARWNNDDYFVLGLNRPSSISEVTKAMRTLSKSYHPDRFVDEDDKIEHQEVFKRITEAKENLVAKMDPNHGWIPEA